jgi:two-component system, NarL family, nitrate/nitrite response regulator NarL
VLQQTIIVATDEPIVEIGIRALYAYAHANDPQFELLSIEKTHQATLRALTIARPSVVVYGLAGETDLNAVRDLLRASPETSIVLWTRGISTELAHQAVNMGVRGFLGTNSPVERFRECVEVAARGELWMEQSLTMSLLNSRPVHLSKRQSQLVQLLVQGLKNKEIAAALGITEGTVKAYLTTLFEKVGARDRFELALFGLGMVGLGAAGGGAQVDAAASSKPVSKPVMLSPAFGAPVLKSAALRSPALRPPVPKAIITHGNGGRTPLSGARVRTANFGA